MLRPNLAKNFGPQIDFSKTGRQIGTIFWGTIEDLPRDRLGESGENPWLELRSRDHQKNFRFWGLTPKPEVEFLQG